jgi:hypothetical protein
VIKQLKSSEFHIDGVWNLFLAQKYPIVSVPLVAEAPLEVIQILTLLFPKVQPVTITIILSATVEDALEVDSAPTDLLVWVWDELVS